MIINFVKYTYFNTITILNYYFNNVLTCGVYFIKNNNIKLSPTKLQGFQNPLLLSYKTDGTKFQIIMEIIF